MKARKQPAQVYNARAGFYDRVMNVIRHEATRTNLARSLPNLPAGARILDVGCGTGLVADFLLRKYSNIEIIGFDTAENMLAIHHEKYPNIPLVQGDFNRGGSFHSYPDQQPVHLANKSFDLVVSAGALSEYGQPTRAIPWCYRLLKPGGMLINIGVHDNAFGKVVGVLWHFTPFGARAFIAACKQVGFSQVELIKPSWKVFPKNLTDYTVRAVK